MARKVRAILDDGGLKDVIILVSGGINEDVLQGMMKEKAPIDGFGIGVNLAASVDVPALDCAYKLQEYAGTPKRKLSEGKVTWPGRKQVWRSYDADGRMRGDILSLENDTQPGEPLIVPVMRAGKRIAPAPTLDANPRTRSSRSRAPRRAVGAARTRLRLSGERRRRAGRARQADRRQDAAVNLRSFPRKRESRATISELSVLSWVPACAGTSGIKEPSPLYSTRARPRRRSRGPCRSPRPYLPA